MTDQQVTYEVRPEWIRLYQNVRGWFYRCDRCHAESHTGDRERIETWALRHANGSALAELHADRESPLPADEGIRYMAHVDGLPGRAKDVTDRVLAAVRERDELRADRDRLHRVLCEIADGHPTPRGYAEKTVGHREDRKP